MECSTTNKVDKEINFENEISEIVIKNSKHVDFKQIMSGVEKIHKSIDWSHYNIAIKSYLGDADSHSYVAIVKTRVVGYVILARVEDDECYIPYIAVLKSFHKEQIDEKIKGIGKKLMAKVFEKCKKLNVEKLSLDYRDTEKLNHFYTNSSITKHYVQIKKAAGHYIDGDKRISLLYLLNQSKKEIESSEENRTY